MAFKKKIRKRVRKKGACHFCRSRTRPDYKVFEQLSRYVSERGRILPGNITDVCSKHQRLLSKEIKRARYLALLKFVDQV